MSLRFKRIVPEKPEALLCDKCQYRDVATAFGGGWICCNRMTYAEDTFCISLDCLPYELTHTNCPGFEKRSIFRRKEPPYRIIYSEKKRKGGKDAD